MVCGAFVPVSTYIHIPCVCGHLWDAVIPFLLSSEARFLEAAALPLPPLWVNSKLPRSCLDGGSWVDRFMQLFVVNVGSGDYQTKTIRLSQALNHQAFSLAPTRVILQRKELCKWLCL